MVNGARVCDLFLLSRSELTIFKRKLEKQRLTGQKVQRLTDLDAKRDTHVRTCRRFNRSL
jgi:hypothetical protein